MGEGEGCAQGMYLGGRVEKRMLSHRASAWRAGCRGQGLGASEQL